MKPSFLPTILYLAENFPFEINGGEAQRIAATILTLTQSAQVHLLCFHAVKISQKNQRIIFDKFAQQIPLKFRKNLIQRFSWTIIYEPKIHQSISWLNWISEFWTSTPFLIWQYQSRDFTNKTFQLLQSIQPEIVHISHLRLASFLPNWLIFPKKNNKIILPKLFYEPQNVEWQLAKSQADYLPRLGRWRWWWRRESNLIKNFETAIISRFDQIFTLSQNDADDLKKIGGKNITVLPIFYLETFKENLLKFSINSKSNQLAELSFIGNLNWLPNADAIKWFLEKIWPILIKQYPEIKLKIIGQSCEYYDLRPKVAPDQVKFTGFVTDATELLTGQHISILPFRMGGGVRFKTLTAALAGHTIVATSLGTQGLDLGAGCLKAETEIGFAQKILELLADPVKAQVLGQRNHDYVLKNHGPTQFEKNLKIYFAEI